MDDDDDDDYFLYSLRFHLPACYTRLTEKKLRLLGPSRMDVCSTALGLEWLRIIMSFVEFFPYMFSREDVHRDDLRERERKGGTFQCEFPLSIR